MRDIFKAALSRVPSESLGGFPHLRRPFLSCLHGPTGMHVSSLFLLCLSSFSISPELWKLDQVRSYWKLRLPHPKPVGGGGSLVPNQNCFLKLASLPSTQDQVPVYFPSKKIIFLVTHGDICLQLQYWGVERKADLHEFKTRLVYLVSSRSVRATWDPVSISRTHIKVEGEISSTKLSSDLHTYSGMWIPPKKLINYKYIL